MLAWSPDRFPFLFGLTRNTRVTTRPRFQEEACVEESPRSNKAPGLDHEDDRFDALDRPNTRLLTYTVSSPRAISSVIPRRVSSQSVVVAGDLLGAPGRRLEGAQQAT